MREYIEGLANDVLGEERPEIFITEIEIRISVNEKARYTGSFFIQSLNGRKMKGKVYSSELRVVCKNPSFFGLSQEIFFEVNAGGMKDGEQISGKFYLVSNGGEYELPFFIRISSGFFDSSLGEIKNLFHFANLAASDWQEAFRVFKSPEFMQIIRNSNKQYFSLYEGLTKGSCKEQHMEEFLIAVRKKNEINYSIDKQEILIEDFTDTISESILITKNNWGYGRIEVSTQASFLHLEKEVITTDDFIGSTYELKFLIDGDKIKNGNYYGEILVRTPGETFKVSFKVARRRQERENTGKQIRTLKIQLTNLYLKFRFKKIPVTTWVKESLVLITELEKLDKDSQLYRAQLLIALKDKEGVKKILDSFSQEKKPKSRKPEVYGYYLYLTTFLSEEEPYVKKVVEEIKKLYKRNSNRWILLWILLYIDKDIKQNQEEKLNLIESQFYRGCHSPVLYLEAYQMIVKEPSLLLKLNLFESQVLWWAGRKEKFTKNVILRILSLTPASKGFSPLLYKILERCYKEYPEKETVSAICSFLIKGSRIQNSYFSWFQIGVEQDLRITRLYEYYMETVSRDYKEPFPQKVLMYFVYNNYLDYKKKAFLYANIVKYKNQDPVIFRSYQKHIEAFVLEQVKAKRINRDLGYLYEEILTPGLITLEVGESLADLLFVNECYVKEEKIKNIILIQRSMEKEDRISLMDGRAQLSLITNDYDIILEDGSGNRYYHSIPYSVEPLIKEQWFKVHCRDIQCSSVKLAAYFYEEVSGNLEIEKILESSAIRESYKQEIRWNCIQKFYERNEMNFVEAYLPEMNYGLLVSEDIGKAVEILIFLKKNKEAFNLIRKFGAEGVSLKKLVNLCARIIWQNQGEYEESLIAMCSFVFHQGKYDGTMLEYLSQFMEGDSKSLYELWKAAEEFEVDHYDLTERILIQILYTGNYMKEADRIFEAYYKKGARQKVLTAYLSDSAYEYLVNDRRLGENIKNIMLQEYDHGESLKDSCKLALLKFYAEHKVIEPDRYDLVEEFLREAVKKEIIFEFFQGLPEELLIPYHLTDQTFVEYKTDPNHKVLIHYMLGDEESAYKTEEMKTVFGGIFVKTFTIFYGEELQYYITENIEEGEQLTESRQLTRKDGLSHDQENKFDLLNSIFISKLLNEESTLFELAVKYEEQKFITESGLIIK